MSWTSLFTQNFQEIEAILCIENCKHAVFVKNSESVYCIGTVQRLQSTEEFASVRKISEQKKPCQNCPMIDTYGINK